MKFKDTEYGDLTGKIYNKDIYVSHMNLTSLEGSPNEANGNFQCNDNDLKTLKGAPKVVKYNFWCQNNHLKTLEGAPKEIGNSFICKNNELISLKGVPKIIKSNFICAYNNIKTFDFLPEEVYNFDCSNNPLTQEEVYKLVKCDIKGILVVPEGLKPINKEDRQLYLKLGWDKFIKLKRLKDKL